MADQTLTLNEEAYKIVKIKEDLFTGKGTTLPPVFSIVFMGDTHAGMKACDQAPFEKPLKMYGKLLNKIILENKGHTLAIVHGGDATDFGKTNLQDFVNKTRDTLYKPYTVDSLKIPLFANVGNHEFELNKNAKGTVTNGTLNAYNELVKSVTLTKSEPPNLHPDVQVIALNNLYLRVILLNTGYGNKGTFGTVTPDLFEKQIDQLDKWIGKLEGLSKNNRVRFIVDMHIPPNIGLLGTQQYNPYDPTTLYKVPHVLNNKYNDLFKNKILDKHRDSILTVVAHHRHCKPFVYDKRNKTEFYLTPAGGNCDIISKGTCDKNGNNKYQYPYHAVKINFKYKNGIIYRDSYEILVP
jgi:hypothetical protein